MEKTRLVIDTDVGTDVDDLFALAYALRHPNADVRAITTVIGNTQIRARIVRKLERILGTDFPNVPDVPVVPGEKGPDGKGLKYKLWTGIEEKALTKEELDEDLPYSRFPVYTLDTKLVCLGPLTNIAKQIGTTTHIDDVKDVYVMGDDMNSHNFKVDKEATRLVFSQPWNIYQITKEVSDKVCFSRKELEEFRGNELGNFLYESAIRWLDYSGREKSRMYDVLTVSAAFEDYVYFRRQNNKYVSFDVNPVLKDKIRDMILGE